MRDGRDDITAGAHGNRNDGSTPADGGEADRLGPGIWKIIAVAVAGAFMPLLSTTMVNVSLLSLAAELHASLWTIQWVTSGYLLALALIVPLNGWLVERIGAKALYLLCFSAFTLSSALCGIAWSANALIAFRILQGMSGGLLAPMAQMMIARAAGKHMTRVMGYAAVPILLAPLLGPVIAGAILQYASWRWLFLINLPVGALASVLAIFFLPNDREETQRRDLDLVGFAVGPARCRFTTQGRRGRRCADKEFAPMYPPRCPRTSPQHLRYIGQPSWY